MSKLTGIKYLEKGLKEINVTEEFYDYIVNYADKCTHLLWRIESLLWELDYLQGAPTKFNRSGWDESCVTVKKVLDIPSKTSEELLDSIKKYYVQLMLESLKEDGDSLHEDLIKWKECLGVKSKKILSGTKKYE